MRTLTSCDAAAVEAVVRTLLTVSNAKLMREAFAAVDDRPLLGSSLDQLSLRDGDQVVNERRPEHAWEHPRRAITSIKPEGATPDRRSKRDLLSAVCSGRDCLDPG